MTTHPPIRDEGGLEEFLSRPYAEDKAAVRRLNGDLLILGAGGKMGPSLAIRAVRAAAEAGVELRVRAVSRFSDKGVRDCLEQAGVETIQTDLLGEGGLEALPDASSVLFLAARKFGSAGNEALTWAMNVWLPARVVRRYRSARIVAFSSGNVYPFVPVASGGATEATPPGPVGEYAQSVLGRERMFEHFSRVFSTPVTLLRLNYAVELRYGVLVDIARRVLERRPISLAMGYVNVIWQGDANAVALRAFDLCGSPPALLNLTGRETLSVRELAMAFSRRFGVEPIFEGEEAGSALLNDASRCHQRYGLPRVSAEQLIDWTAGWLERGGESFHKPTHYETRDGRF